MGFKKNNHWDEHQKDPDNWIKIPDFNVLPVDVWFEGFAYPIMGATVDKEWPVRVAIWNIVKAVRSQAKKRFKSLADLKAAHVSLIERVALFDKEFTTETYSHDEAFAFRYQSIFYNLERCLAFDKKDKNSVILALASVGAELAEMMIEKPIDGEALREIRSGIGRAGAIAKLANDPKQTDKAQVKECWKAWQEEPSRYKNKAKFAVDMLDKYENLENTDVIGRWCTAWKKEAVSQQST